MVFQEALDHYHALKRKLELLESTSVQKEDNKAAAPGRLPNSPVLRDHIVALDNFFSTCLEPAFYAGQVTVSSVPMMEKVFHTQELLEMILCNLSTIDLLAVDQVDRLWHNYGILFHGATEKALSFERR